MLRTYSEIKRLETFLERFKYLSLGGRVGETTFGFDRYVNQRFYRSQEWKHTRQHVIIRDNGCDLGLVGHEIREQILIHHMNPMDILDIVDSKTDILNPDYLIATTLATHNAIHYGDESLLPRPYIPRHSGDTKLW